MSGFSEGLPHDPVKSGILAARIEQAGRFSEHFLPAVAGDLGERVVDVDDIGRRVGDHDPFGGMLEDLVRQF